MGFIFDLKLLKGGFYLTIFSLFAIGLRYKDLSIMFTGAIYTFNIYLTFALEE